MKKLITSIFVLLFFGSAFADEFDDMLEAVSVIEQVETVRDGLAVRAEVENYVEQRLWYIGQKRGFFAAATAYQNTFYWYMWRDFHRASGFEKLEIGELLKDN